MATLMKFQAGGVVLQFEAGGDYPANRKHEIIQTSDRTASGDLQVETLGITIKTRVLSFNLMSKTDYDALIDWFLNTAQGGQSPFDFTDEYGDTGEVRFLDTYLNFSETSLHRYSGTVNLEYTQEYKYSGSQTQVI